MTPLDITTLAEVANRVGFGEGMKQGLLIGGLVGAIAICVVLAVAANSQAHVPQTQTQPQTPQPQAKGYVWPNDLHATWM